MITYLLIMLFMFFICYVTCVIISFTIFMAVIVTLVIAMGFVILLSFIFCAVVIATLAWIVYHVGMIWLIYQLFDDDGDR